MTNGNFPAQNQPEFGPREGFDFEPPKGGFDLDLISSQQQDPLTNGLNVLVKNLPGVQIRGYYEGRFPIVTFLYHKTDDAGNFETVPRTVLVTGIYEGEHPGHAGQGEDAYLHGVQVNNPSDETGKLLVTNMNETEVSSNTKNFAFNSIYATGKTVVDARTGARQFIPEKS